MLCGTWSRAGTGARIELSPLIPSVQGDTIDRMNSSEPTREGQPKSLSKPANKRTTSRLHTFLDAYAESGNVRAVAAAVGMDHNLRYRSLKSDPEYRTTFEALTDRIGQAAARRSSLGENSRVYSPKNKKTTRSRPSISGTLISNLCKYRS